MDASNSGLTVPSVSTQACCLHCNRPVPRGRQDSFCCPGCEAVYRYLGDQCALDYYTLRENSGVTAPLEPVVLSQAPAPCEVGRFDWYLEGVSCAACAWLVERQAQKIPGLSEVRLDVGRSVVMGICETQEASAQFWNEVRRLGYEPHRLSTVGARAIRAEDHRALAEIAVAGAMSGNLMLMSVALYAGVQGVTARLFAWVGFVLVLPVVFYSARPFWRGVWGAIKARQWSLDAPIVIGMVLGVSVSVLNLLRGSVDVYFDSIAMLIFLLRATRYALKKIQNKAQLQTQILGSLFPGIEAIPLVQGSMLELSEGQWCLVDGEIESGEAEVSTAFLTGEPALVRLSPGEAVSAGVQVVTGKLRIRVEAAPKDTRFYELLQALEQAQLRKAPIQQWADRVGARFVQVALGAVVCVGAWSVWSVGWAGALERMLVVSILTCPCVFALATPLTLSRALARAAELGIWIKDASFFEKLLGVRSVALDKTGTLTLGRMGQKDSSVGQNVQQDPIREQASGLITGLQKLGLPVHLLTGDQAGEANRVAAELGIPLYAVHSGQSPEGKARWIEDVLDHPFMLGDGANDALALSKAHVSIAVRGPFEVSLKSSDAVLARPNSLGAVPELWELAERTLGAVKRNLWVALLYNVVAVVAGGLGWISPLFAAVWMPISALLVLISAVVR